MRLKSAFKINTSLRINIDSFSEKSLLSLVMTSAVRKLHLPSLVKAPTA